MKNPVTPERIELPHLLEDWQACDETLDPRIIAEQGQTLLSQNLNSRRMLAFVGSGVSAGYGRATWSELATLHIARLREVLEPRGAKTARMPDGRAGMLEQLKNLLPRSGVLPGDRIILAMMLCEQIWVQTAVLAESDEQDTAQLARKSLAALVEKFGLKQTLCDVRKRGVPAAALGIDLFRTWIKLETHDERSYVLRVLGGKDVDLDASLGVLRDKEADSTAHADAATPDDPLAWQPLSALSGLRFERELLRSNIGDSKRLHAYLFESSLENTRRWKALLKSHTLPPKGNRAAERTTSWLMSSAGAVLDCVANANMSPARYYALAFALDLARIAAKTAGKSPKSLGSFTANLIYTAFQQIHRANVPPRPVPNRLNLIKQDDDILHRLVYDLGIRRFATTNYDLEIERYANDIGFRAVIPTDDTASAAGITTRVGPLGGQSRDFVLNDKTFADFLDFATSENTFALEVVHMHGMATKDTDIIVTERDYQHTYVRNDEVSTEFREAREATFGGNPILFIGFGMSESDVLRPLREFVVGRSRRNRAVIALLSADDNQAGRKSFTLEQYVRNGVSVIYYGLADEPGAESFEIWDRDQKKVQDQRDWSWIRAVLSAVDCVEGAVADMLASGREGPLAAFNDSARAFLEACCARLPDYRSKDVQCPIDRELEVLQEIVRQCSALASVKAAPAWEAVEEYLGTAVPNLLGRVRAAIRTAALNTALKAIRNHWKEWLMTWPLRIPDRADFVRYAHLGATKTEGCVWSRHRVNESWDPSASRKQVVAPKTWRLDGFSDQRPIGPRCLVISAARGRGKGHLYSLLAGGRNRLGTPAPYVGQFFVNFHSTCEIASVWDVLPLFLLSPDTCPTLASGFKSTGDVDEMDRKAWLTIQKTVPPGQFRRWSRRERLERALYQAERSLSGGKTLPPRRILIALFGLDLLFDVGGRPKQPEIGEMFEVLLSEEYPLLPLDLVLSGRKSHLPALFRRPAKAPAGDSEAARNPWPGRQLRILLNAEQVADPVETRIVRTALERSGANTNPALDAMSTIKFLENRKTSGADRYFIYMPPSFDTSDFDWPGSRASEARELLVKTLLRDHSVRVSSNPSPEEQASAVSTFAHGHLASSRFAFSLIAFVIVDIVESDPIPPQRAQEQAAAGFIDSIKQISPGYSEGGIDLFLEIVFDYWFNRRLGDANEKRLKDDGPVLDEIIVRHIAVMNMPASAAVLAECPLVKRQVIGNNVLAAVTAALGRLVRTGLILRQDEDDIGESTLVKSRYQVHRAIQDHIYRRLGSQHRESGDGNVFAPSLYAAQARGYPRLKAPAYAFLNELVDALAHYPRTTGAIRLNTLATDQIPVFSECLRAALGVTRTLFSLGVVARFADADGLPHRSASQVGYLEHHRLAIAWMIRLADWLDEQKNKFKHLPPFYRDEIVWLYNECGVFSYAQGKCYAAKALFQRALTLQADIEGRSGGPTRRRILLNEGMNAIDRGRLTSARKAFDEVRLGARSDELSALIATGYCGVIDYYSGEFESARSKLDLAVKGLQDEERVRPLTLLKMCTGFLNLYTGRYDDSQREFAESLQLAEAGGFSDLVHTAYMGALKAHLRRPGNHDHDIMREQARSLDVAEAYADRMDIPRLKVDVVLLRAEVLLRQNETTLSGTHVTQGLRIANLNGLTFRKIFALELLARVYRTRGHRKAADRLDVFTQRAARSTGYHLSVFRKGDDWNSSKSRRSAHES